MKKVTAFGEIMLRLSPPDHQRIVQCSGFDAVFGGSEANVAVTLSNMGIDTEFVTKLPKNELGISAENSLRRFGVSTKKLIKGEGRLGIYFLEKGASQRPSKVIYDREGSALAKANKNDFCWDEILSNTDWFHWSGITPAISEKAAEITLDAVKTAKKKGITVSCDLNYRSTLWTARKAGEALSEMMEYTDILIANEEHLDLLFGIKSEDADNAFAEVSKKTSEKFGISQVAMTIRRTLSADDNKFGAVLYKDGEIYRSKVYNMHIVDRVGGGDSFAAGLIYGNINNLTFQDTVEFAAAAGCLKHSVEGDVGIFTADEVKALANGSADGRVIR